VGAQAVGITGLHAPPRLCDGRDRREQAHVKEERLLVVTVLPQHDAGDGSQPLGQLWSAVHLNGQGRPAVGVDGDPIPLARDLHGPQVQVPAVPTASVVGLVGGDLEVLAEPLEEIDAVRPFDVRYYFC
jgi:hypothetical protein